MGKRCSIFLPGKGLSEVGTDRRCRIGATSYPASGWMDLTLSLSSNDNSIISYLRAVPPSPLEIRSPMEIGAYLEQIKQRFDG